MARSDPGDVATGDRTLSANQQGIRLMLDEVSAVSEWSLHVRAARMRREGYPVLPPHSSELFRGARGGGTFAEESSIGGNTSVQWELDRALYRYRLGDVVVGFGRQAIDWGAGRLWQPLNVFGAFAPTDLDTDFKPGIDALSIEWYPSPFSTLHAVYAFGPRGDEFGDSAALHYRRRLGETLELGLLAAGEVLGGASVGASVEGDWDGMGWLIEGLYCDRDEGATFWVAGISHQFDNGVALVAEWYDNDRGARRLVDIPGLVSDPLLKHGLMQHMSRRVLGLGLEKDLTPLLHGGYTILASTLDDASGHGHVSTLHQINLNYSLSNESDLLVSLLAGNGMESDANGVPRSEFGSIPKSLMLRYRLYF